MEEFYQSVGLQKVNQISKRNYAPLKMEEFDQSKSMLCHNCTGCQLDSTSDQWELCVACRFTLDIMMPGDSEAQHMSPLLGDILAFDAVDQSGRD